MNRIYSIVMAGILTSLALLLGGCSFSNASNYKAAIDTTPASLGATAVAVQTGDGISKHIDRQKLAAAISEAIGKAPGASATLLPPPAKDGVRQSDYELILAARQANAKTLCVVNIDHMGSVISIGVGIPPYEAHSFADYEVRLLDVQSGRLLVDSVRKDATYHPFFVPPENAVADMRRGIDRALGYGGYLEPKTATPATQPLSTMAMR